MGLSTAAPRPLGTPFTTYCGEFIVRSQPAAQTDDSMEAWTIERSSASDKAVGSVAFELRSGVARVSTFDIEVGNVVDSVSFEFDLDKDTVEVEDEAEDLSRFVLQLLGSRLQQLGASEFEPQELIPMINVAADALACPEDEDALVCCDTDGRPLLPLPRGFVDKQRLLFLDHQADGSAVVARGGDDDYDEEEDVEGAAQAEPDEWTDENPAGVDINDLFRRMAGGEEGGVVDLS